jgi:hypothetical protein
MPYLCLAAVESGSRARTAVRSLAAVTRRPEMKMTVTPQAYQPRALARSAWLFDDEDVGAGDAFTASVTSREHEWQDRRESVGAEHGWHALRTIVAQRSSSRRLSTRFESKHSSATAWATLECLP